MAEEGSTLKATPLKEEIKDLTFKDKVTHFGNKFNTSEKKQWWDKQPDKKFKVGLIRNKELDVAITIFTESFDFSKKVRKQAVVPATEENDESVAPSVLEENDESVALTINESVAPSVLERNDGQVRGEGEAGTTEEFQAGFNSSEETPPVELPTSPETIGTTTDFDRLYLGWLDDDTETRVRKNILRSLFRFVFGKKQISDVTATKLQKKFRIAYTPLTVEEKIPCKDGMGSLWSDFRESLLYRRDLAIREMYGIKDAFGETNFYVDQKKRLILGLRDLVNVLEQSVYPCFEYGYDDSMMYDEEEEREDDEHSLRLLKVFRTFVKDKKEGRAFYSLPDLKQEFTKKDPVGTVQPSAQSLYEELLTLLTWTSGDQEATRRIYTLESELEGVRKLAKQQEVDIQELEDLVLLLSVALAMTDKIYKLQNELQKLAYTIKNSKRGHKTNHKELSDTSQKELKRLREEYSTIVSKIKKHTSTREIEELEDILLILMNIIVSMEKTHTLDKSLIELKSALEVSSQRHRQLRLYERQLESLEHRLAEAKASEAHQKAALAVSEQGRETAKKIIADLRNEIDELKEALKDAIQQGESSKQELQIKLEEQLRTGGTRAEELQAQLRTLESELRDSRNALLRCETESEKTITDLRRSHSEKNITLDTLKENLLEKEAEAEARARVDADRIHQLKQEAEEADRKAKEEIQAQKASLEDSSREILHIKEQADRQREEAEARMGALRAELEERIESIVLELTQTRKNRNSARTALNELQEAIRAQEKAAEEAILAAQADADAQRRALAELESASEQERTEATLSKSQVEALLAEKEAEVARLKEEKTSIETLYTELQAENAKLGTQLWSYSQTIEALKEAHRRREEEAEEDYARRLAQMSSHAVEEKAILRREFEETRERDAKEYEASRLSLLDKLDSVYADHEEKDRRHREEIDRILEQSAKRLEATKDAWRKVVEEERVRSKQEEERVQRNMKLQMEKQKEECEKIMKANDELAQQMIEGLKQQIEEGDLKREKTSAELNSLVERIRTMEMAAAQAEAEATIAAQKAAKKAEENQKAAEAVAAAQKAEENQKAAEKAVEATEIVRKATEEAEELSRKAHEDELKRRKILTSDVKDDLEDPAAAAMRAKMTDAQKKKEYELLETYKSMPVGAKRIAVLLKGMLGLQLLLANRIAWRLQSVGVTMRRMLPLEEYINALVSLPKAKFDTITPWISALLKSNFRQYPFLEEYFVDDLKEMYKKKQQLPKLQGGGAESNVRSTKAKQICDTLLTLLLLEAKQTTEFDVPVFLEKVGVGLQDLGQCPLVLHVLKQLLEDGMEQKLEEGYMFSPLKNTLDSQSVYGGGSEGPEYSPEFLKELERLYSTKFTPEEKVLLENMGPPITIHPEPPEEFKDILGTDPYFLTHGPDSTTLYGLEEVVNLTPEEEDRIKSGGIPLGAILFFYLISFQEVDAR